MWQVNYPEEAKITAACPVDTSGIYMLSDDNGRTLGKFSRSN